MKRLKVCVEPLCPKLIESPASRCTPHQRIRDMRYRDPRGRKVYQSPRWKGMRRAVLRDNPWCQECGLEVATEVDHVVSMHDGGHPFERTNLQSLCKKCHSRKTGREVRARV